MRIINFILDAIAWALVIAAVVAFGYITYVLYFIVETFSDIYWYEIVILVLIVAFVFWRFFRR